MEWGGRGGDILQFCLPQAGTAHCTGGWNFILKRWALEAWLVFPLEKDSPGLQHSTCVFTEWTTETAFLPKGIVLYFKLFFNKIELCCVLCFLIENVLSDWFCNVLFTANETWHSWCLKTRKYFCTYRQCLICIHLNSPTTWKGDLVEIKIYT